MKVYTVKEIYYTIQGEGYHTGRAALFCRFAGCNLWSGLEKDRSSAICKFCDTDFVGTSGVNGGKYGISELLKKLIALVPKDVGEKFVVFTGGEPLLQLDETLLAELTKHGFYSAIETNGTIGVPKGVDWVCVSPKYGSELVVKQGNEMKLVFPQKGFDPKQFSDLQFDHYYLQPMDGPNVQQNTRACIAYCMTHPQWKLSIQTHKVIGIA